MFFQGEVERAVYQSNEKFLNRNAERAWRFRHLKTPEAKIAAAILTSVLGLFIR